MLRPAVICVCLAAAALAQKPATSSGPPAPPAPVQKSAFDKPTLEAYLRHLMGWFPPIQVEIGDPRPSDRLPGFKEVQAKASLGQASQQETLFVSDDGRKILRASVYDISQNPFKYELDRLKTEFEPSMGTPGAPVVLVVFTDFQCPYCKQEAKVLRDNLLTTYPKQVRLYFKNFPLESIHKWAKAAAIAGRCVFQANPQAFWDYHDWIYANQEKLTPDNLKGTVLDWAKDKNIDTLQLDRCLETRATEPDVEKDMAEARALGVNSTPTLFINGRRIAGQLAWPQLKQIIDHEIEYQKTAHNAGEDCGCDVSLTSPSTNGSSSAPLAR